MPKICSDNLEEGDGDRDEMVDWGDVRDVEVRSGLAAFGSTSTVGAGVRWITMRTSNFPPFKCTVR